jgi:acyl-CoA thioesterase
MSLLHPFDQAIALEALGEHRFGGRTDPAWANMVGPFGGITAATLLNAACLHPQRLGDPVALTVNFAGPVADGAFEVVARPVRTNRSTQHWSLEQWQAGELATSGSAVFALRRETWAAQELSPPAMPPVDQVAVTPPARVAWPNRYQMRFVAGAWPLYGQDGEEADSRSALWVRDEPPRPLDAVALAAMCDLFYPRVFRRRGRFAPAGTVSITSYFHADAAALARQGARPLMACAEGQRFHQGFFDQRAELWSDDGLLLASSHQVVYYKS